MESSEVNLKDGTTEQQLIYIPRTFKQKLLYPRWELPVPEKCCYCLPLRYGFLVLAYIKLVVSLVLGLPILYMLLLIFFLFIKEIMLVHCLAWFAMFLDVMDIIVGIFIIVSAHKKNIRLMEIYYKYSIYVFGLLTVTCSIIFHVVVEYLYALLILILIFLSIILVQVYLILMVRGEVLKLKSNAQFQFLNNEPEPHCTYINNIDN